MWDLPRPALEPVSPALAGGFLTTAPPGKSNLCVLKLFLSSVHIHLPNSFFMSTQYYTAWMCHHVFNQLWDHFYLLDRCVQKTLLQGTASSHSFLLPIMVSYVVSVPPPRGTKFDDELPHSLQYAQPLTSLPPDLWYMGIIFFAPVRKLDFYPLNLYNFISNTTFIYFLLLCSGHGKDWFHISRPLKTVTCHWDVTATKCHVTLFPSVIHVLSGNSTVPRHTSQVAEKSLEHPGVF